MLSFYRAVLAPTENPLRGLPPAQRFQAMLALSVMWIVIFCAAPGAWAWYGEPIAAHVLIALGFLVTGLDFRQAQVVRTYRDYPRVDRTARYDDVWGA